LLIERTPTGVEAYDCTHSFCIDSLDCGRIGIERRIDRSGRKMAGATVAVKVRIIKLEPRPRIKLIGIRGKLNKLEIVCVPIAGGRAPMARNISTVMHGKEPRINGSL
jgi:hypothetical protein